MPYTHLSSQRLKSFKGHKQAVWIVGQSEITTLWIRGSRAFESSKRAKQRVQSLQEPNPEIPQVTEPKIAHLLIRVSNKQFETANARNATLATQSVKLVL